MFIRNLYETRRMEYTIYNALGKEPSAWRSGKPLTTVQLTIRAEDEAYTHSFWPWRDSELESWYTADPTAATMWKPGTTIIKAFFNTPATV